MRKRLIVGVTSLMAAGGRAGGPPPLPQADTHPGKWQGRRPPG